MSATATVGTMLDSARLFESELERFLGGVRDISPDGHVRLLSYYLVKFKRHLAETLAGISDVKMEALRRIPLRNADSEFIAERAFTGQYLSAKATAGELLQSTIEVIDVFVSFYEWLIRQPLDKEAKDLLELLLKKEQEGLADLKKLQAKHYA